MKTKNLYCGRIGYDCPNKGFDGRCKTCGHIEEFDEFKDCEHVVEVKDDKMNLLVRHLYMVRSDTKRAITTASIPEKVYPNDLYCSYVETVCPYQAHGGKCTLVQCMPSGITNCGYQITLDKETELVERLIQFIHFDKEKLLKQIEQLKQNKK